jgi:lysozyme
MANRLKKAAALMALTIGVIGGHEGLRTKAYLDVVRIPTICFGETRGVKMGDVKTVAQCKEMLGNRLLEFEGEMRKCVRDVDALTDGQFVAFMSFQYNVGSGAFCRSTLVKRVNEGKFIAACNELLKWNRAGGMEWAGLTRRRKEERKLCMEDIG